MANEGIYPMWVTASEGRRCIVPDHIQHGQVIGKMVGEDGKVIEELMPPEVKPHPPSVATVLAAGYTKEAAEQISAKEAEKAAAGEFTYGESTEQAPAEKPSAVVVDDPFGLKKG